MAFDVAIPVVLSTATVVPAVAETIALWDSLTAFVATNNVYRVVDGIHVQFEALQSSTNKVPEDEPTYWQEIGPTNAWAMWDDDSTSQTSDSDDVGGSIYVPATQRVDCFYAAGLDGLSLRLQILDPIAGSPGATVYDVTHSLSDPAFVTDWYAYFNAPLSYKRELLLVDLPSAAGATLILTVAKPGDTARCGAVATGYRVSLGNSRWGWRTEIRDYSRFIENAQGNRDFVPGAYRKLANGQALVENRLKDAIERILTDGRGAVRLYIVDPNFTTLAILGTATWAVEMSLEPDMSLMSAQLESNV